jgi:hypothetical protein
MNTWWPSSGSIWKVEYGINGAGDGLFSLEEILYTTTCGKTIIHVVSEFSREELMCKCTCRNLAIFM